MWAAFNGQTRQVEVLELLVAAGADLAAKNTDGCRRTVGRAQREHTRPPARPLATGGRHSCWPRRTATWTPLPLSSSPVPTSARRATTGTSGPHHGAPRAQSRRERGLPYNMRAVTQRTYNGTRSQAHCGTRGRSLPQVCGVRRGGAQGAASVASPCGLGPGRLGRRNAGAGEASRQRPRLLCCIAPLSEGRFCTGAYMIGSALGCRMAACAPPKQVPLQ